PAHTAILLRPNGSALVLAHFTNHPLFSELSRKYSKSLVQSLLVMLQSSGLAASATMVSGLILSG
ncbi:MAG: hypothetical protein ACKN9U_26390, partial [Pirellulaceae bacterium]